MKKRKIGVLLAMSLFTLPVFSQKKFTVSGEMTNNAMMHSKGTITKVYLQTLDATERNVVLDSVDIVNNKFSFTAEVPKELSMYFIGGFDNGGIAFFAEEGNIKLSKFKASTPVASLPTGTPSNDVFGEYLGIQKKEIQKTTAILNEMGLRHNVTNGDIEGKNKAYAAERATEWNESYFRYKLAVMDFLIKNKDAKITPMLLSKELAYIFRPEAVEKNFLPMFNDGLKKQPYYKALKDNTISRKLSAGATTPEISSKTIDGKSFKLSSLRGKYVFIDIWASWCAPCVKEFPYLTELNNLAKDKNFAILSVSIDDKEKNWKESVAQHNIGGIANWIHVSDLVGWGAPVIKEYGVSSVPRSILIDPEGKLIAFDLRGQDMVNKITKILSGDLYYKNEKKD